jgi:hypothetical protein
LALGKRLRETLLERFRSADPSLAGVEELLLGAPGASNGRFRPYPLFRFEALQGWKTSGDAFGNEPRSVEVAGQDRVYGSEGRYVSSLHATRFEAATGRLVSPNFVIRGDALTFVIGGGLQPEREGVELVVDGQRVRVATGCDTEVLGRRVWSVSAFRGKSAHVELVDDGRGSWAHVTVDEIVEWRRANDGA